MLSLPWLLGKDEVLEHFMHDSVKLLNNKKNFFEALRKSKERKYLNNFHFF